MDLDEKHDYTNLVGELHTFECPTLESRLLDDDDQGTDEWKAWKERCLARRAEVARRRRLVRGAPVVERLER